MNVSVSDVEDRLREAYRAAADTIEPGTIRALREPATAAPGSRVRSRRRPARARMMIPLAAAAAVVAIAVGVPALLSGLPSATSRPTGGAGPASASPDGPTARSSAIPPSGRATAQQKRTPRTRTSSPDAPPFFVAISGGGNAAVNVYSTGTAKMVAAIPVPRAGDSFYGIAMALDPHSYVVAVGHAFTCGTRLYWLKLNSAGQFAGLTPFEMATLPEDVFSIALNADGDHFAWAGEYCAGPNAGTGDIGVADLGTLDTKRWTAPGNEDIGSLSLSGNGSRIGFVVQQTKLYQPAAGILPVSAPPGTVAQRASFTLTQNLQVANSQLAVTGPDPEAAALSPDGGTDYVCDAPASGPDELLTIKVSSPADAPASAGQNLAGSGPCALSLDPSGRFLLAQTSVLQLIDLATGSVTVLPVQGTGPGNGVWVTW